MKIKSFEHLIFSREGKVILGNRWKNAIVVLIILLATFFSLGLSKGSTEYLKTKMDDPFNTWVSFKKNRNINEKELNILIESLNSDSIKNKFHVRTSKTHLGNYIISPTFNHSLKIKDKKNVWHITLTQNDTLFQYITREMLQVRKGVTKDSLINNFDNSYGIIIKKSLIKQLGLKLDNPLDLNYLKYRIPLERVNTNKKHNIFVSVPILGVVENLPLGVDFICSRNTFNYIGTPLYNYATLSSCNYEIYEIDTNLNLQIFISDAIKIDEVESKTNLKFKKLKNDNYWESPYLNGSYYNLESNINLTELNKEINAVFPFNKVHLVEPFDDIEKHRKCEETDFLDFPHDPSYVTIQLNDLKKISELKYYLDNFPEKNNFEKAKNGLINIDISSVKSRKNLLFISELTKVLSIFLLIFSMFSILIFLINIINTHFEKIKQNIGTLKAFGLSNNKLITNYILIYSLIIFATAIIAFVSSVILGQLGFSVLIFNLLDITIEDGEKCFELLNFSGLLSFFFIITLSISVVYFRLRKILLSTPGDLIFER